MQEINWAAAALLAIRQEYAVRQPLSAREDTLSCNPTFCHHVGMALAPGSWSLGKIGKG